MGLYELLRVDRSESITKYKSALHAGLELANRTLLFYAAARCTDLAAFKQFLAQTHDININDIDGITPLMAAALCNRNPEIIEILVEAGADAKAIDNDGRTALMYAVMRGAIYTSDKPTPLKNYQDDVLIKLLHNPGGGNNEFNLNSSDIAVTLLRHGADVNAIDRQGDSALMHFSQKTVKHIDEEEAVYMVLLINGADVNQRNNLGMTPLVLAVHQNASNLVDMLLAAGASCFYK
jgi:ankyrin repeat protein